MDPLHFEECLTCGGQKVIDGHPCDVCKGSGVMLKTQAVEHKADLDPKLKLAMAEIKATLQKYDAAGFVVLCSKTHGEFHFLGAPWSPFQPDPKTGWRFDVDHRGKTEEEIKKTIDLGVHHLYTLRDVLLFHGHVFGEVLKFVGHRLGFRPDPPSPRHFHSES